MGRTSAIARLLMQRMQERERIAMKKWRQGWAGRCRGGRPPKERRCTKRIGSRLCWNWREEGCDRCWRHRRGETTVRAQKTPRRKDRDAGGQPKKTVVGGEENSVKNSVPGEKNPVENPVGDPDRMKQKSAGA